MSANTADAGRHRLVVTEETVSVEFDEIGHDRVDVIEEVGACGMACDLDALPGGQVPIEGLPFLLEVLSGRNQEGILGIAAFSQFGDPVFEFGDGEFKIERLYGHDGTWFVQKVCLFCGKDERSIRGISE
jgi:hypothetical protein